MTRSEHMLSPSVSRQLLPFVRCLQTKKELYKRFNQSTYFPQKFLNCTLPPFYAWNNAATMFYTKQINNQSINNWYIYFLNHNLASKKEFRYVISARVSIARAPIYTCITPTLRLPACLFLNIFSQLWNFPFIFLGHNWRQSFRFLCTASVWVLHRAFRFYTILHLLPVCLLVFLKIIFP